MLPRLDLQFILTTDACKTGIGFFLSQKTEDGCTRPVSFGGRQLNKHEQLYPTYQLEFLALISAVKKYSSYLTLKPFQVFCDNTCVIQMLKQKVTCARVARWILFMSNFQYEISHLKGTSNKVADSLSRLPNLPLICSLSTDSI